MRTTPGYDGSKRLLVAVDLDQKEKHSFTMLDGTKKSIYLGSSYSENHAISQPTMAEVVTDCDEIKAGDIALFTHMVLSKHKMVPHWDYMERDEKLFIVDKSSVAFIIREDKIIPIGDNLLVERLYYPEETTVSGIILSTEKKQIPNRIRILAVPDGIDAVKVGDIVMCYPMSDYGLIFNKDNVQQEIVRCLFSRDVIGIDTNSYENN